MEDSILSFLGTVLVGILSLFGVIITNNASNTKMENQLITSQAVTDTKIQNLTEEVRKHNNFASKIPVLETRVASLEKEVSKLRDI